MSNLFKSKFLLGMLMVVAFAFTSTAEAAITMTLRQGMNNSQVKELQQNLNGAGFTVSTSGAGSVGNETTYFGSKTKAAVVAYQTSKGLVADGIFGPASRAAWTGGSMTYPAGCTSSTGFSTTTGLPCSGTTTLPAGCNVGDLFSSTTGLPCTGGTGTTQTGPVTAMLASTNPASGTLVAGQATANLANFTFTGNGTVTGVTLQRLGVSADTTPSNVYLFDGAMRLTDAASVSSNGMVTFTNPNGLFTVSGSKTISVKSDIAGSTSGQTVGMMLATFTTSSGTTTANLSGNIHTIASATLASVAAGTVTPTGATLNPGAGVTVWQSTLTVSTRDVMMKRISFRNVGSAPASAFGGFKLFVNGVQVATATSLNADGYVTFDLMANPVTLQSGSRVLRLDADIVSGASRTVQFSMRSAADVDFVDSSFGVNVSPTSAPWGSASANTISGSSGGTLTIEKDVSSPAGNVAEGTNDKVLGVFKVTAYGEPMKIENLRATFTGSDADVDSLRNGRILINGVQYGSTATLMEDSSSPAYTQYTLNYTVYPGTPVLVELRADMYDNDGTDNLSNGDTIIGTIAAGSSNVQKVDSLGSVSAPNATTVAANTLVIADASATLTKNATYANQTVALPSTNFKIGSWNLAGSSVEEILFTTLSFDVDEVTVSADDFNESDITNMYVVLKDANGNVLYTSSPLATVSAADNNFSINYTLAKNTTIMIELYGNLGSSVTAGEKVKTDLTATGTAMVSGASVDASSGNIDGQTLTAGTASITVSKDASSPVTAIVHDNQTVTTLAAKFAAVTAGYTITDMTLTVGSSANTVVQSVMVYDGATLVASGPLTTTTTAVFNGLNVNIPANTSKVLTVKLQLGTVGVGAGTSGATITTSIANATHVVYTNQSTGVSTSTSTEEAGTATGSAMYVYASTPTITLVPLPSTTLGVGTQTVSKFSIASNGGTIGWKYLAFTITKAIGGTDTLASATLWDADTNTQIAGTATFTDSVEDDNDTAGGLTFVADDEQQINGTKTYVLKMTVAGTLSAGNNMTVSIAQPLTDYDAPDAYADVLTDDATATFVWTDQSASSHSASTEDWNHGFLVKNLPTDTQVLTY